MPSAAELAELDDEELEARMIEYRRELLNLRFQLATSQLDNTARVSGVRKDIARVMTIMRDREIALAEGRDIAPVYARPRIPTRLAEDAEELVGAEAGDELEAEDQFADDEFGPDDGGQGDDEFEPDDDEELGDDEFEPDEDEESEGEGEDE